MQEVIRTLTVSKNYGTTLALDRVSLTVRKGEIYGCLGLNGAGKTTLIRILLGMIKADEGAAFLFGDQVGKNFGRWNDVGYLVETPHPYPDLTVAENLRVFQRLRGIRDKQTVEDIIGRLQLGQYRDRKAGSLSLGNRQRLGLAKAMFHRPPLLILDEPVNGLDPQGIVQMREMLKDLSRQGTTILLSSHLIDEVSKVATRIGIIHNGRSVMELDTVDLVGQLRRKLVISTNDDRRAAALLEARGMVVRASPGQIHLHDRSACDHPEIINRMLVEGNVPPRKLMVHTESLEDLFLRTINPSQAS